MDIEYTADQDNIPGMELGESKTKVTQTIKVPDRTDSYWTADEVHFFDDFVLEDNRLIIDFNGEEGWMHLSGTGMLAENGIIEHGRISNFTISGDLEAAIGDSLMVVENTIIDDDATFEIQMKDSNSGHVVIHSVAMNEDSTLIISDGVKSVTIVGSIFQPGARIQFPDDCEVAMTGCIFYGEDFIQLRDEMPQDMAETNAWPELESKKEEEWTDGWALPIFSLVAAGVLGAAKAKKKTDMQGQTQKVQVVQEVKEEVAR